MRVLLDHGADVNARKNDGTAPFHEAAQYGRVEAMRVLIDHGADVNARKNDGTTPLHEAAQYGKVEAMRVLIDHGADVNARKNDGTAPLHRVFGMVNAICVLLKRIKRWLQGNGGD